MNDLAVHTPKEIIVTGEQQELIKTTVCQGATESEMQLFFYDCQRRGVHPLDRLIHFTKRGGKYTPITSIDFMRQRAHASGVYAGEDEPIFTGTGSHPETCTYSIYRLVQGQRCRWTATVRWGEYYPGDGAPGFMWRKMPYLMLSKTAEALALRKAFPEQLQGLYVKEELDQAEASPAPMRASSPVQATTPLKEKLRQQLHEGAASLPDVSEAGEPPEAVPAAPSQSEDSPADPWLAKLKAAGRNGGQREINAVWRTIPEEVKQDCYGTYSDTLKACKGK